MIGGAVLSETDEAALSFCSSGFAVASVTSTVSGGIAALFVVFAAILFGVIVFGVAVFGVSAGSSF